MKTTKEERQDYLNELQVTYEDNINIQMIQDIDLLQAQNEIMRYRLNEFINTEGINPALRGACSLTLERVDALERNEG